MVTAPVGGAWRAEVGPECIGSGSCVALAPHRFQPAEGNRSRAVEGTFAPDESVLDAAASCPAEAITVTDVETGQVVEP
ncbi:ferredoxin [Thalassiella azotivora]